MYWCSYMCDGKFSTIELRTIGHLAGGHKQLRRKVNGHLLSYECLRPSEWINCKVRQAQSSLLVVSCITLVWLLSIITRVYLLCRSVRLTTSDSIKRSLNTSYCWTSVAYLNWILTKSNKSRKGRALIRYLHQN